MKFRHNSTIGVKKRKLDCGCFDYAFSNNLCKTHATALAVQKRIEKESEKMIEEDDLSDLIADADLIFSQFIRLKYADADGMVKCYTCNIVKHWTLMQCGHFAKRGNLYLRFDERNCRPQEATCNEINYGMPAEFLRRLNKEEEGLGDILLEEARIVHKPTRDEIRQVIAEYSPKVTKMKFQLKKAL